jgi:hypothetical protein
VLKVGGSIDTDTSTALTIKTVGTTAITVDTSQNVGIGTTSPAYKLDVAGSVNVSSDSSYTLGAGADRYIKYRSGNGDILYSFSAGNFYQQSITSSYHAWFTNNAERMRIDSSGNVGIGTTSQIRSGKLSVSGTISTNDNINWGPAGNGRIFSDVNWGCIFQADRASPSSAEFLWLNAGGTSRMLIDTSGIVTMSAYGAGAATFSASGVISSVSDETWKVKDGEPVDPDLMINKLEPGYWYYNDEKKETFGTDRQLGFYAQNVNAAIGPEAAPIPEEGKPWGYYDRSVLAVTVMSLKKALATIESLTARIAALESN